MNYQLTKEAEEDLIQLFLYGLERFGENQAEKYYHSLENAFERIANNPWMYPEVPDILIGYRYCVHISHTIYFKAEEEVTIIRIIGRQKFLL